MLAPPVGWPDGPPVFQFSRLAPSLRPAPAAAVPTPATEAVRPGSAAATPALPADVITRHDAAQAVAAAVAAAEQRARVAAEQLSEARYGPLMGNLTTAIMLLKLRFGKRLNGQYCLRLKRHDFLRSTFAAFEELPRKQLVCGDLYVKFEGESAVDQGGPYREMWSMLKLQILADAPDATGSLAGLFEPINDEPTAAFLPAPGRGSAEDLAAYRRLGKVLLRLLVEFPDGQAGCA